MAKQLNTLLLIAFALIMATNTATAQIPSVQTPTIQAPGIQTPGVPIPSIQTPSIQAPGIQTPSIQAPGVPIPGVPIPGVPNPGVPNPCVQFPILVNVTINATVTCPTTLMPLPNVTAALLQNVSGNIYPIVQVQADGSARITIGLGVQQILQFILNIAFYIVEIALPPVHNCTGLAPNAIINATIVIAGINPSLQMPANGLTPILAKLLY